MALAMGYIVARFRSVEAMQPEIDATLDSLRQLGFAHIAEILQPVADNINDIDATLSAIQANWASSLLPQQVRTDVSADVIAQFSGYLDRYLGALDSPPSAMPDGSPIPVGELYFDTGLNGMQVMGATGWVSAGGVITSTMEPLNFTAAEGQDTFAVAGGYNPGFVVLALNGMLLTTDEFVAADGESVVLAAPCSAGDVLSGYAFGSVTMASVYSKAESDSRYRLIADSYAKTDVDTKLAAYALSSGVYARAVADTTFLKINDNLAAVADKVAARGNLGLGTAATMAATAFAGAGLSYTKAESDGLYSLKANTLDLTTGDARYLQLVNAYDKGASDGRFLQITDNLAALPNKATARGNLGLGSAATMASSAFVKTDSTTAGITLHTGTGAPANTLGVDGDIYIG